MPQLTTARRSGGSSTPSRADSARTRTRPDPVLPWSAPPREDGDRTEAALRLVYQVVVPRMLRSHVERDLGLATPNYNRLERTHEFYMDMAAELGDWWWRLARDSQNANGPMSRRMEREHLQDAGEELASVVLTLPREVRRIVESRAAGVGWRDVARSNPDRAFFSIRDDWEAGLNWLWLRHEDLVRRLC